MFKTENDIMWLIKRICQARGNLKINVGQLNPGKGFETATLGQAEKILTALRQKYCKVVGYTEKCIGAIPYEVSISVVWA